ncbi:tetratricopeptide repeat protein [Ahniella affigens]|uniref:tetratricopeptide repeat protein n=1 Tax=Ahniella affigens TaxID=2021234 RepID=UPI001473D2B2|nr:tetratricopeptide repeat protein [Ahniella affigens]
MASDDARVLSWPWEALSDPQVGDLAHLCRIERQLDKAPEPMPLPEGLPKDRVCILLVTARPYQNDIAYRSITRPLVELIQQEQLPAEVKLLRPPTFEQLRRELQAHPGHYHIVHFDGHGGFGSVSGGSADRFKSPQGQLVFENADGSDDAITGAQLSQLLREHGIPIAVLNACQSAMINEQAEDAFASVATALLRAGVRSVVAMGYSLYVSGARQFLPAFYRQLFITGNVAEATRSGRGAMLAKPQRRGDVELQDWLVPVLYQQDPVRLTFSGRAKVSMQPHQSGLDRIPEAARVQASHAPHGVIGRDSAVLELERASRRAPPALLLHGLGGVGKTTLARGYIEWLAHTQGLPDKVIWQSLAEVRSFDYLRNRLVEELFGTDAMALPDAQKWPALIQALREHAVLIVWDNFESASGAADAGGTELEAMPAPERQQLKQWLEQLRGGRSRVLITSRSDEQWLGTVACYRMALGGLEGEERQELAQAILADQGLKLDPRDEATTKLIDSLMGHPLMMRAILPKLASTPSKQLRLDVEQYLHQADSSDPVEQWLYATLRYIEAGLPEALRPLLLPIGLHEGYIDADFLTEMAQQAQQPFELAQVCQALELLELAGLVRGLGNNVYEMHPALARQTRLRSVQMDTATRQAWEQGFCLVMASLADNYAPKELHEQRPVFAIFGDSFQRALELAQSRNDLDECGALLQAQAVYALNRRNLALAAQHYEAYAKICEHRAREDLAATPYHQLGRVAQERREFDAAEAWYRKSLAIEERQGNEHGAALTYHQLGRVAQERRDFDAAEAWYRKSLAIEERQNNEQGAASIYHHLGVVAQERRNFDAAEAWCRKSLAIWERRGDEHRAAVTYHQFGRVAEERRDFDAAEAWYRKSLAIKERQGNDHGAAITYHQLGVVAQERRDFDAAEAWYRKSLAIWERQGDEHYAAITYHQLGRVAEERRDFDAAEAWYRKSLAIKERQGNQNGAAISYGQLGNLAIHRRDFDVAEAWYRKALAAFERTGDRHYGDMVKRSLGRLADLRTGSSGEQSE